MGKIQKNKMKLSTVVGFSTEHSVPLTISQAAALFCSDVYDPVCGSNGQTYRNGCYMYGQYWPFNDLWGERITKMHDGECEKAEKAEEAEKLKKPWWRPARVRGKSSENLLSGWNW